MRGDFYNNNNKKRLRRSWKFGRERRLRLEIDVGWTSLSLLGVFLCVGWGGGRGCFPEGWMFVFFCLKFSGEHLKKMGRSVAELKKGAFPVSNFKAFFLGI